MIVRQHHQAIILADHLHVAFAVGGSGQLDAFAKFIAQAYWPDLAKEIGTRRLGEVLTHTVDGRTFYACVVYASVPINWTYAPTKVTECLDQIRLPDGEVVGIASMGLGLHARLAGANQRAILAGMERTETPVVVYQPDSQGHLFTR